MKNFKELEVDIDSDESTMTTCENCKHCVPEDFCGGDCECCAKAIEVSQSDDIHFYGDNDNEPCKDFTAK